MLLTALFIGLLAALPIIINHLFAKEFIVHKEGVIVITGASSGIGRHAAESLATLGYQVYAGVRKQSDADEIIAMKNPNLFPIMLEVTSSESIAEARDKIESVLASTGLPMVSVINNAGIAFLEPVETTSMSQVRKIFDVNYFGAYEMTKQFLPFIRKSKGRFVMISSVAGIIASPTVSAYSGSKYALEALADSLRREMSDFGVSVSVIEPGFVKSKIIENAKNIRSQDEGDSLTKEQEPYKNVIHAVKTLFAGGERAAPTPEVTTADIVHAITSVKPHTRYVNAIADENKTPAVMLSWMAWLLPDRVLDVISLKDVKKKDVK